MTGGKSWVAIWLAACAAMFGAGARALAQDDGGDAEPATQARERYALEYVGFEGATIVFGGNSREWTAYQGKYHRPLEGADFYRAVGRDDLLGRYRSRQALRVTLVLGGIGVSLAGLAVFGARHSATIPLALVFGGGVLSSIGWYMSSDPVDGPEAREAADLHNKALKRRLGLEAPRATPYVPAGQLTVAPVLLPGGAAFALRTSF